MRITPTVLKAARQLLKESTAVLVGSGAYQVLSFLTGLWIIRTLPIEQYALFGLALSITTVLTAVADSGISQAVIAIGGRSHGDTKFLGHLIATCRRFVAYTAALALVIAIPLWVVLSFRQGAAPFETISLAVLLVFGLLSSLGGNIYRNVLLLNGKVVSYNAVEAGVAGLRLIVSIGLLALWPTAIAAVLVGILALAVRRRQLQTRSAGLFANDAEPLASCSEQIKPLVKRAMPNSLYVAFSQQFLFFALAFMATPQTIASASALSRFNQIYLFVPSIVMAVLAPRFAKTKAPHLVGVLYMRYFVLGAALALLCGGVMFVFPQELLKILGSEYSNLENEVRLFALASSVACVTGVMSGLNNSRGWVIPPLLYISLHLAALTSSFMMFHLDSVHQYFLMMLYINALMAIVIAGWSFVSIKRETQTALL